MDSYKKKKKHLDSMVLLTTTVGDSRNRGDFAATVLKVMYMQIIEFDGRCFSQ